MSVDAIVMMVVAMVVLWGGLGAAIVNIVRFTGRSPGETMRDL